MHTGPRRGRSGWPRSLAKGKPSREPQPELTKTDQRRVRLEILERGVDAFTEPRRDIFRLTSSRSLAAVPQPVVTAPPPAPTFAPPPVQMATPTPGPAVSVRFNVLGTLRKDGRKTVFLGFENEIFIVKEGDRFGKSKEFEVAEIADEKVIVRQGDRSFPITIPVPEQSAEVSFPPAEPASRRFFNAREPTRRIIPGPARPEPEEETEAAVEDPAEPVEPEKAIEEGTPPEETSPEEAADGNMSSLQLRSMIQ